MIAALFRGIGKLTLLLAATAFLTAVSLFLLGSYILTWPILRKSPRERRIAASVELATAGMAMLAAIRPDSEQ